jgi:membrane protease YdiL (CAAX protease family)
VIPVAIMLLFERTLVWGVSTLLTARPSIAPTVLFYVPFSASLPPLLLFVIWWGARRRNDRFALVFAERRRRLGDIGLGLMLAVPCILIFIGSLTLLQRLSLAEIDFSSFTLTHHVYFSTIGALVPGVTEEIYFRGFLAKALDDLSPATIVLLTSLSFSLWHVLTPSYLLHTFLIGLVLAVAYHRTGRILPIAVAHTAANASAGVLILNGVI